MGFVRGPGEAADLRRPTERGRGPPHGRLCPGRRAACRGGKGLPRWTARRLAPRAGPCPHRLPARERVPGPPAAARAQVLGPLALRRDSPGTGRSQGTASVRARPSPPTTPWSSHRPLLNETNLLDARAWTAVAGGDLPGARRHLEAAAELGEQIGDLIGATTALHDLARMGRARQVAARLAALAESVEGDLVKARAAVSRPRSRKKDGAGLEAVSAGFEDSRCSPLCGRGERARPPSCCASAARSAGPRLPGKGPMRLLEGCEGAVTPALRTNTARVTPDSRRAGRRPASGRGSVEQGDRGQDAAFGEDRGEQPATRRTRSSVSRDGASWRPPCATARPSECDRRRNLWLQSRSSY